MIQRLSSEDIGAFLAADDPIRPWLAPDATLLRAEPLIDLLVGARDPLSLLVLVQRARCRSDPPGMPPHLDRELLSYLGRIAAQSRIRIHGPAFDAVLAYSHRDRGRADLLAGLLRETGLHLFCDIDAIRPGDNILSQLTDAINRSPAAILLITRDYLGSEWTRREFGLLLGRSREGVMRLLPVLLDDVAMPPEIADICTVDLRGFLGARDLAWARERLTPVVRDLRRSS